MASPAVQNVFLESVEEVGKEVVEQGIRVGAEFVVAKSEKGFADKLSEYLNSKFNNFITY